MRPSTFSGIHLDDEGREFVTHIPSGTRYYVNRNADGWSAFHPTLGGKVPTKRERKEAKRLERLTRQTPLPLQPRAPVGHAAMRRDPPRARMLPATIRLPRVPITGGNGGGVGR